MALAPLCLGKSDGWKQMDLEKYLISNLTNFLTLLVLGMVDNLERYELGAVGHHVQLRPHGLVLVQHLRQGLSLPPPALELEHWDPI